MKNKKDPSLIIIGVVAILAIIGLILLFRGATGQVARSGLGGTTWLVEMTPWEACGRFTSQDGTRYVPLIKNGQPVINKALNIILCIPEGMHPGAANQDTYDQLHIIGVATRTGRSGAGPGTPIFTPYPS